MLTLLLGRAGSGKTTEIANKICEAADRGVTGQILLVPDQYSHEAERELCERGGNSICLSAEVLTFTRLVTRVQSIAGGLAEPVLDEGGRLLVMQKAFETVRSALHFYGAPSQKPELLKSFVDTMDELKSCRISPDQLSDAAAQMRGGAKDKLSELALIYGAYEACASRIAADPRDALTRAAEQIAACGYARGARIYIDGFSGFTPQEFAVVGSLLKNAESVTLALTCGGLSAQDEQGLFSRARHTAARLSRLADRYGIGTDIREMPARERKIKPELGYIEDNLLSYGCPPYPGECGAVEVYAAKNPYAECEFAASRILSLVRERDCRYRDIAVLSRVFGEYESVVSAVFERYGVPVYMDRTSDILQKPVLLLVTSALDALRDDFGYEPIFRYLKTGLAGISPEECDRLENYVLTWNIRGSMWTNGLDWRFNPNGYTDEFGDADRERLDELNRIRARIIGPFQTFAERAREAQTAREQAQALYAFMESISLPETISKREALLRSTGRLQQADEYAQLWDILCRALEQCALILDDTPMELERFGELFKLVLSQYDVGTIPVALDRVTAGSAERMRRRNVKYVFVLGATDSAMPLISGGSGLLTDNERELLEELGLELSASGEQRMNQELDIIYSVFTMPSEKLYISYPMAGADGSQARPSFMIARLSVLFPGLRKLSGGEDGMRLSAPGPCFALAAGVPEDRRSFGAAASEEAAAAYAYFSAHPDYAEKLSRILHMDSRRGPLGAQAVDKLIGPTVRMSASRMDQYRSCRFSYFMKYGLSARPRRTAGFEAPEIGTFVHFILEKTISGIMVGGGFESVTDGSLRAMIRTYTREYVDTVVGGLDNKTSRFRYLFNRLIKMVDGVVKNTVEELRQSDFIPLDFELHFADGGDIPAVEADLGSGSSVKLTGFADRVDGWVRDGVLYLRIVDYKTGVKKFDLSDIWYGLNLQMLAYLFALEKAGQARYGMPVAPAGVLYVPAREVLLRPERDASDEELKAMTDKMLRRSGLLLDQPEVLRAMEKGMDTEGRYIPVRFNRDGAAAAASSVANAAQIGLLRRHMEKTLEDIGKQLQNGRIEADPYYRSRTDTACLYCDYADACLFDPGAGRDKARYLRRLKQDRVWEMLGREEDV